MVNHYNIEQLEEMYSMDKSHSGLIPGELQIADSIKEEPKKTRNYFWEKESFSNIAPFLDRHRFDTELRIITSCSHYLGEKMIINIEQILFL